MDRTAFINSLGEILEVDEGAVSPTTVLSEVESWDSMAALSVIALFDSKLKKRITASDIRGVKTVSDLLALAGL